MSQPSEKEFELDLTYYLGLVLRRRWVLASVWLSIFIITALVTFSTRPVYQAASLIVIEKERGSNNVIYQGSPLVDRGNDDYYQTQYKLLKSESLLTKVFAQLNLQKNPDFSGNGGYQSFKSSIDISPVPRSRLVYIKANSHNPQLSADIANTLSELYIESNMSNQLFISQDVLQALQNKQSSPNSRQLLDSLPAVVNNVLVQQLKQDSAKLEAQVAELSGRYTDKHPQLSSLKAHLGTLKAQIKTETDKIIQSLKVDLSGQLMGNNIRIIDQAVAPDKPIKPRKILNLLLGFLGGLLLGLAAAFITDTLDQTIRTHEDVENILGLPFLGMVPYAPVTKGTTAYTAMLQKEQSLTGESVRNLRTMIDFAEVSQKNKTLIISSSAQGEGKSYICANLAVAIAQAGEKVLLVDGDLRRSNVHRLFALSNSRGISEFLAKGRAVDELEHLVQKCEIENLDILPCGPRPPNPAELLNTPRLKAFFSWANERYDRILVDCPPIFPVSDTLLWSRYINSAIFVVKYGHTRVPLIREAARRLQTSGMKILGCAVNMSRFGGLSYYHGQYYHKYGYHYYSQNDGNDPDAKKISAKK